MMEALEAQLYGLLEAVEMRLWGPRLEDKVRRAEGGLGTAVGLAVRKMRKEVGKGKEELQDIHSNPSDVPERAENGSNGSQNGKNV